MLLRSGKLTCSDKNEITVRIQSMTGITYNLDVKKTDTIITVKEKLKDFKDIPIEHQEYIFRGKLMDNKKQLYFYNIENMSLLTLSCKRLVGGMMHPTSGREDRESGLHLAPGPVLPPLPDSLK